ncbi:hypothetical protein EV424DRAFT_1541427 [Suillus variegatus]|nr:hypothetical protein EV424DRAFT_1541427 [Suillus variegatus]
MDSPTRLGETTFPLPFSGDIDQDPQVVSLGRLMWAFFRWIRKTDSCIPCEFDLSSACLSVLTRQNGSHAAARFLRPAFTDDADISDRSDVAVEAVLQHIVDGGQNPPAGYSVDPNGLLTPHNESEVYESEVAGNAHVAKASNTGEGEESKEMPRFGRGQRKRIANTLYNDFWSHK